MGYNLNYSFDENLRDVPENPKDVRKFIQSQMSKLKAVKDPVGRVKILEKLGSFSRMIGELDEAQEFLGEALELIGRNDLGIELWVANGIRLAHVFQWQGNYDVAREMFLDIMEMCEDNKEVADYLHFTVQHLGKYYFDLGEYEEAFQCFEDALEMRKEIGDIDLIESSQFALKVTEAKLKESYNVVQFPSNQFQGDGLKSPKDILEMVKMRVEGQDDLTLEDLNEELNRVTFNQNNMAKAPFLGLSPADMHNILYTPFRPDNEIFTIKIDSNKDLDNVPLVQHALFLLEKIHEKKQLKATQKGNFPRSLVLEVYSEFFSNSRFSFKPNKEDDLPELTRLKHLLDMAGLLKKRSNKFSVTKKGEKILSQNDKRSLFSLILDPLFNKWNWGYTDAYSELMLIQSSAIFNIYLLHKKAQDWIHSDELGKLYLEAFPALVNEARGYFGPEKEIIDCFETRFLNRFCLPLGLLDLKDASDDSILSKDRHYRVSDFFKNSIVFH